MKEINNTHSNISNIAFQTALKNINESSLSSDIQNSLKETFEYFDSCHNNNNLEDDIYNTLRSTSYDRIDIDNIIKAQMIEKELEQKQLAYYIAEANDKKIRKVEGKEL